MYKYVANGHWALKTMGHKQFHLFIKHMCTSTINISEFLSLLCTDRLIEYHHLRIKNELEWNDV